MDQDREGRQRINLKEENNVTTILCIPDLHIPFEHSDALEFVCGIRDAYKPDIIVNLGDEVDQYAFSLYDKSPDSLGVVEELDEAIESLAYWVEEFPKVKVCYGNHSLRYLKKALRAGIPERLLKGLREFLDLPKSWEYAPEWIIQGIRFFHGEPFSGPQAPNQMLATRRQNQVHGHLHGLAGVTYENNGQETLWVLSCGCLIDEKTYAFHYTAKARKKPILGVGLVVDGVPVFEPMR